MELETRLKKRDRKPSNLPPGTFTRSTAPHRSSRNFGEQTIHDAIEAERSRLMTAEAILHCVVVAIDEYHPADLYSPDYESLIDLPREPIKHAIDQFDSLRVKPMSRGLRRLGLMV